MYPSPAALAAALMLPNPANKSSTYRRSGSVLLAMAAFKISFSSRYGTSFFCLSIPLPDGPVPVGPDSTKSCLNLPVSALTDPDSH